MKQRWLFVLCFGSALVSSTVAVAGTRYTDEYGNTTPDWAPAWCGNYRGATGTGFYLPKLLDETLGTKFNIILGYQGGGPIDLAVEKGEIQCRAMTIESFFAPA